MPRTENQKAVTAYLSLELYDQLRDFKIDEGLKSDSQAIAVALERFFTHCLALPVNTSPSADEVLKERLEQLEKKIDLIEFHWKEQRNDILETIDFLLYQTRSLAPQAVPTTVSSDVPSTVESTVSSDVPSTVESTVDDNQRFVVCAYHPSNPKEPLYWHGRKKGFKAQLESATSYAHQNKAWREVEIVRNGLMGDFLKDNWKASCKTLGELRQMQSERAAPYME